jgi:hypothetical protein
MLISHALREDAARAFTGVPTVAVAPTLAIQRSATAASIAAGHITEGYTGEGCIGEECIGEECTGEAFIAAGLTAAVVYTAAERR